jgi:hypothetical protein
MHVSFAHQHRSTTTLAVVNYPTHPDDDFAWIQSVRREHDRLYTGPLADELWLDLPFLPHVGIANAPTPGACKAIVDDLNAHRFEIPGRVETVSVVGYDGETVWTIVQVRLSGAGTMRNDTFPHQSNRKERRQGKYARFFPFTSVSRP